MSHESENLHDSSQRDLCGRSAPPCVADILWLAGRNRRLDGADVVKLDRSRRRRRLELLRNSSRHAWLTQRKTHCIGAAASCDSSCEHLRFRTDAKSASKCKLVIAIEPDAARKIRPNLGAGNPPHLGAQPENKHFNFYDVRFRYEIRMSK